MFFNQKNPQIDKNGNYVLGDFVYRAIHVSTGYAHNEVKLEKIEGNWPADKDLITIADNPGHVSIGEDGRLIPRHFGGTVTVISKTQKLVKVYSD